MKAPRLTPEKFALLASLLLVVFYNPALWLRAYGDIAPQSPRDYLFIGSFFLFITAFINFFISPFAWPRIIKPVVALLVVIAATVTIFSSEYGVIIDRGMIQNIMETDLHEAGDYLSLHLLLSIALYGLLPALVLLSVTIKTRSFHKQLLVTTGFTAASLAVVGLMIAMFFPSYASLFRKDRELRLLANPTGPVYNAIGFFLHNDSHDESAPIQVVGADAHKGSTWKQHKRPALVIVVIGETARADNFSLTGYKRLTNPKLSRDNIIYYPQVTSCGTATAKSLPCMLSPLSKESYNDEKGRGSESVLDVLDHAGIAVLWLDNNSGCKGACDRIEHKTVEEIDFDHNCKEGECYDEALLHYLKAQVANHNGDLTLVLHQQGSHGPSYYRRIPPQFERFTPTCHSSMLSTCSLQQIRNAYDNTILYTDWVLDSAIHLLQSEFPERDTALLYVSDHGESLGEHNLYLHGAPDFMAPKEQTHVPMLTWLSQNYIDEFGIDSSCLRQHAKEPFSHDNLFHSVLGMLQVETSIYDPSLDIFSPCHQAVNHQGLGVASRQPGAPKVSG